MDYIKNASKHKENRSKKAKSPKSKARNKQVDISGHNSEQDKFAHAFPDSDTSSENEQHVNIARDHALRPESSINSHKEALTAIESPSSIVPRDSEVSELSPLSTPQTSEIDIAKGLVINSNDTPNATIYDTALQHKKWYI